MGNSSPIIVALDFDDKSKAQSLLDQLSPQSCKIKIGKSMFTQFGPEWVKECVARGFDVFLDLKFHDIPNTVYDACYHAAQLGVWMINVHALGGNAMLKAAKEAMRQAKKDFNHQPLLIGVTVLTSMTEDDLVGIGIQQSLESEVMQLASLCQQNQLDGVVCSAKEARLIKQEFDGALRCVTPGIRLPEDNAQDQKRVLTPEKAIAEGSDYLVIGRSITQSLTPSAVIEQIEQRLLSA